MPVVICGKVINCYRLLFFHAFKIFFQKRKHTEIFRGCIQMSTYERKLMNKQF